MTSSGTRTLWSEGREPGREMVALGVALALTGACLDLLLTGHLGVLFDLCFVLLCVALALAVRPADFFTVGVLPPLLMLATFALLGMSRAEAIAARGDGVVGAVLHGLSAHAAALVIGYLLCLGTLAQRRRLAVLVTPDAGETPVDAEPRPTRTDPGRRLHA